MNRLLFILILPVLLCCCDDKEEIVPPSVETKSFELVNTSTAKVIGIVNETGNQTVKDYGFVYSSSSYSTPESGSIVSLGKAPKQGQVTADIPLYETRVYVRMFLTNSDGTAFGKELEITTPSPNIESISPTSGKVGDQIKIYGSDFSTSPSDNNVSIGGITASVIGAEPGVLTVLVPNYQPSSSNYNSSDDIHVSIGAKYGYLPNIFTLLPAISEYSPKNGSFGTMVTVKGTGFRSIYDYNSKIIYFGDNVQAYYTFVDRNTLTVEVPEGMKVNTIMMKLLAGSTLKDIGEFTLDAPTIESFAPQTAIAGLTRITVKGKNFKSAGNKLKIGNVEVTIYRENGKNTVSGTLPESLAPGSYEVQLFNGIEWVTATGKVEVIIPAITELSATTGYAGSQIIFTGNFISTIENAWCYVYFGNYYQYYYSMPDLTSQMVVTVPEIPSGIYEVKFYKEMYPQAVVITVPQKFTVLPPKITSFTPTSGYSGDEIKISGDNLQNCQVYFGSISARIISQSFTEVKVQVPTVNSGVMKISIVKNNDTIISQTDFTVKK